jgi:hypothetical protein
MGAAARASRGATTDAAPAFGTRRTGPLSVVGGIAIAVAQLLTAAGLLPSLLFFFYLLALFWELGIATFAFAVLLIHVISSRPTA